MLRPPLAAWVGCMLLIAALVSTLVAFNAGNNEAIARPSELTSFAADPNPVIVSLAAQLSRMGVSHVFAGYWVANDLTFISNNRITALAIGENRNPPGATNVGNSTVAWVFVPPRSIANDLAQLGATSNLGPGSITEASLIGWLTAHGVSYRIVSTKGFDIILPSRNVTEQILG